MKKWLTFFLLAICLTANFYPCCDSDDSCIDDLAGAKNVNHKQQKSEGTCSPFYTCGTCSGFTATYKPEEIPIIKLVNIVHPVYPASTLLVAYQDALLQPPRVI